MVRTAMVAISALAWVLCAASGVAASGNALTLDEAMAEARAANAALPVSKLGISVAEQEVREADASKWPEVGVGGDVHDGSPEAYTGGDARLQLAAGLPLLDGGRRGSERRAAAARARSATAGFRLAERDLDFEVEARFSEILALDDELAVREEGLSRLRSYLEMITALTRAGQGGAADLQKTRVRLGLEEADMAAAQRRRTEAAMELNDLLGRAPGLPLTLAPLPPPVPPAPLPGEPWRDGPDVARAAADREEAGQTAGAARAEGRPQLNLSADAGVLPTLGGSPAGSGLNNGEGWGGEVTLEMLWPLWDGGARRARVKRAELEAERAARVEDATLRRARLQWERARADLDHLYREIQIRSDTVPAARDAYLETESLYRGGEATAVEVLDAFTSWVEARRGAAEAEHQYRVAQASLERWGAP